MDIAKLKVTELREELKTRGLDTKGNKPVLVERLRAAIEAEQEQDEEENEESSSAEENSLAYETAESTNTTVREAELTEERAFSVITSTAVIQNNVSDKVDLETSKVSESLLSDVSSIANNSVQEPVAEQTFEQETEKVVQDEMPQQGFQSPVQVNYVSPEKSFAEYEAEILSEKPKIVEQVYEEPQVQTPSNGPATEVEKLEAELLGEEQQETEKPANDTEWSESMDASFAETNEKAVENDVSKVDVSFSDQTTLPFVEEDEKMETEAASNVVGDTKTDETTPANADSECLWNSDEESSAANEAKLEEPTVEEPKKRVKRSRFDQPDERKRKHSGSSDNENFHVNQYEAPPKIVKQDDEPSFDENSVLLSWYDSDLNLEISKENFVGAVPLCEQGFMYMWAGARSTYGFNSGKIYYDVKLLEKCQLNVYDDFEVYAFRLGWSVQFSSLQLGEDSLSYGYDSAGKKCTESTFEDYGQPFNAEDVVGCLLDFESNEDNVLISYTFNGVKQEVAFEVPKSSLENKALFPHVISKNIRFEVNFGERSEPWIAEENFKEEFEWASKVPLEQRVRGPKKPESKSECEMVMLCGLPCSGKTTWVNKHVEENKEKMYNIIGINYVLSRMKVLEEPIQSFYKDPNATDILMERCTKCVNRLCELATIRWRNYILDQTNVFATIQRRKMRNFEGFNRTAIVILPSEEEYEKMLEKWDDNKFRDTSVSLLELKGNFKLPEEGELFNSVSIVGVEKEQADEIIRKYNKEGRDARARDDRRFNRGYGGRDPMDNRMHPYGRPPMGGYRQRWMDRGPPPPGRWGPRGGMDRMPPGFRERRNWRESEDDREGGFRGSQRYPQRGMGGGGRYGGGSGMMGSNRNWNSGRDRDRMGQPRSGGPQNTSGPNPLMSQMMGKPPMLGYGSQGERKSRFSDEKRRDDSSDADEYRVNPPGVDEEAEEPMEDGSGTEGDGERKRYSRFSDAKDTGFRGRGGGFQGRGMGNRNRPNDRGRGGFQNKGGNRPGGGGYKGRDSDGDYGRGGGQRRDNRDRNQKSGSRFEKRDNGNKNDGNSQATQAQAWGMYGQTGWNQAAAASYQNWAQYQQQAGYSAQQMQQYWSQMQQQQQNQSASQSQSGQANSKGATGGSAASASNTSQSSNQSSQQSANTNVGYNTQGYNTAAGYSAQGYDANAYAQYCAQYYNQLAQQGWTPQNAWAAYGYGNYGAMAGSGANAASTTSVPSASGNTSTSTNAMSNQGTTISSGSNK